MQRTIYLLALLLFASLSLSAQTQSFQGYLEAGDQASQKQDHYNAYRLYQIATEYVDSDSKSERAAEAYYKTAVAAYKVSAFEVSEDYLMMLDSTGAMSNYPMAGYYLGQSQFRQGLYDQAVVTFTQFIAANPAVEAKYLEEAALQIRDADMAIDMLSHSDELSLRHLSEINTEDSDVAYVKGPNNTRYYSSNPFEWEGDSLTPHRTLSRIMRQGAGAGAEPLGELINVEGKNVAHTAFTPDMQTVYYSVCDFSDYDQMRCDLYKASVDAAGEWSNPQMLSLNQAGYYTGQPNVGTARNSDETRLYFSSDRPGGKGGRDLYYAPLSADGTLGTPVNLAKLNTEKDDVTPFFHQGRNTLFFATDGRFTFGGLDIYRSNFAGGEWREPTNLGAPINSAADDAYYTQFDDPDQAYIASRRKTGEAIYYSDAKDVCCYDIYEFAPPTGIDLRVLTFNDLTKDELEGVTVALYQMTSSGPELIDELTNLESNEFEFTVEPGGEYQLKATKDGFTEDIDQFDLSSPELMDEVSIERKMFLAPAVKLDVFTYNSVDERPLPGTTVKLFEVAGNGALMLVDEVTNTGGNDSHFLLEIGKNYQVDAMKAGFGEATTSVDLRDYDPNTGSRTMRRDLYLGQALEIFVIDGITKEPLTNATVRLSKANGKLVGEETNSTGNDFRYTVTLDQPFYLYTTRDGYFPSADTLSFNERDVIDGGGKLVYYVPLFPEDPNAYLPFEVYFDNDYPNPDTYTTRTRRTYEETFYPYMAREPIFKEKATEGLPASEAFVTRSNVDQFFDQEVEDGWILLSNFSRALEAYLANGNEFEIELAGYASPRAPAEYNRRLSARRNMSLQNYLRKYGNGTLAGYLKGGQLSTSETALGESTANLAKIYERIDRERESIYSVEASLERKVVLRKPVAFKK